MAWYRGEFDDKGSGATSISLYVEGSSEEDARRIAASREDRYGMYDMMTGEVWKVAENRDEIETKILSITGPNEGITADGTVLMRNLETNEIVQRE